MSINVEFIIVLWNVSPQMSIVVIVFRLFVELRR